MGGNMSIYILKNIQTLPSCLDKYLKEYHSTGYMKGKCYDTDSLDDAYVIKDRSSAESLREKISKYTLMSYVVVEIKEN